MKSVPLFCVLLLALSATWVLALGAFAAQASPALDTTTAPAPADQLNTSSVPAGDPIWTRWNPTQYALAEDAESIWIGAEGSIVRWHKASQSYDRYTAVDGLPHQSVVAVAVDGAGNRWFGGDGGLSLLDAAEHWSHFTVANSGLHSNNVDAIAVGADNTLWLGHGQTDGSVSRRNPDGTWQWIPSRAAAVAADYAHILQTQNPSRLWTIAGDKVWVGYAAYNGSLWTDHTPADVPPQPVAVVADSAGTVWALPTAWGAIYKWDGAAWSDVLTNNATSLAVGADDTVWVGWQERPRPYSNYVAGYTRLGSPEAPIWLDRQGPVAAILPAATGIWVIGPGWLLQPNGTIADFGDTPLYPTVNDVLVDSMDRLWLHSERLAPYSEGVLQVVDDRGDPDLTNDSWIVQQGFPLIMASERTLGGDLWVASYYLAHPSGYDPPRRFHDGAWVSFPLPQSDGYNTFLTDIFALDERHTWFAYARGTVRGVLSLDDGGTIADLADDQWIDTPIQTAGIGGAVSVDSRGRVWFGDSSGIYRYEGAAWRNISQAYPICDLTPAANGVLFAQSSASCDNPSMMVLVIETDTNITEVYVDQLVHDRLDLVRSAQHRNRMWSSAPDGAVWYLLTDYLATHPEQLRRRSATELTVFSMPFVRTTVRSLAIDPNNHAWLAADGSLWRMTGQPDFTLAISPSLWLLAPGESRQGSVEIGSQEGFRENVTLAINGLPTGVTALWNPAQTTAGQRSTLTLQAGAGVTLGTYPATVLGTSTTLTHTTPLTVMMVSKVHESILPEVSR